MFSKNLFAGFLAFSGFCLIVILILAYPLTLGCINKSHGKNKILGVTSYEKNGLVLLDVDYELGYDFVDRTCDVPFNPNSWHTQFLIDGFENQNFLERKCDLSAIGSVENLKLGSQNFPSLITEKQCNAKIILGSNDSRSVTGQHTLKLCSNFDFMHFPLGINVGGHLEKVCASEILFNYH